MAEEPKIEHVSLKVADEHGNEVAFKIKKNSPLQKMFDAFAQKQGKNAATLKFTYEGNILLGTKTPEGYEMEDEDMIQVQTKQEGGM